MIDTKKEQERDELHRAIWAIADELRGAVDGWDFKNYVLGTMFYRYISENLTSYINNGEAEAGLMPKKREKALSRKRDSLSCPANSSAMSEPGLLPMRI